MDARFTIRPIPLGAGDAGLDDPTVEALTDLLVDVVADGASLGFLHPLARAEAAAYWRGVPAPGVTLLVAEAAGHLVGTAQLQRAMRANGRHRAEVCKLMVHPTAQRRGIGRALMEALEAEARRHDGTLLVLDTRDGDPSNQLYRQQGWIECGRIPGYARSSSGTFDATVFYYKQL